MSFSAPAASEDRGGTRFSDHHDSEKLESKCLQGVITCLQFKIWAKTANQKPRYTSESQVELMQIIISAGDFGKCALLRHEKTRSSTNQGTGMVSIERHHENMQDSILPGLQQPRYNGRQSKIPVIAVTAGKVPKI